MKSLEVVMILSTEKLNEFSHFVFFYPGLSEVTCTCSEELVNSIAATCLEKLEKSGGGIDAVQRKVVEIVACKCCGSCNSYNLMITRVLQLTLQVQDELQ